MLLKGRTVFTVRLFYFRASSVNERLKMDVDLILDEGAEDYLECGELEHVSKVVRCTLAELDFDEPVQVALSLTDLEGIRSINKEHRGIDEATDVLSFPQYSEDGFDVFEDEPVFLGDIVLCSDKVHSQAKQYGHSRKRELSYLICHSVLHLMGYDHIVPEEKAEMRSLEETILAKLNLSRDL